MDFLPEAAGPHDPILVTPARAPGSIRRTTTIDTTRPDGLRADARVDARARDLRTNPDGTAEVVAEATLQAVVSPTQKLVSIATSPDVPALQQLIGGSAGPGFRSRLNDVLTEECEDGTPLFLLLDDFPAATLVSGYALLRGGLLEGPPPAADNAPAPAPAPARPAREFSSRGDLCAGWAHDATMMLHIQKTGRTPVPEGPPAPTLEPDDDPLSCHAMPPLPPLSMRRRRRLDLIAPVVPGGDHRIDLHFRDSHVGDDGIENVVHEYTVTGTADAGSGRIVSVTARAQVLPWLECPGAVASAERIAGMELSRLRPTVRKEFVGRSTCTHLNDTLRSLADIASLARELEATPL